MKNSRSRLSAKMSAGFTLVELMMVVAIIGILASVATPAFMKYIKRSKTTEARMQLEKIYNGARSYFYEVTESGKSVAALASQFPADELTTPAGSCCTVGGVVTKCAPSLAIWDGSPTWAALKFSVPDPHYYQYEFKSSGITTTAEFTAYAYGDLDCDLNLSTFTMFGFVDAADGDPTLSAAASRTNELE
jgi:type IV pilus assembly protein PilA